MDENGKKREEKRKKSVTTLTMELLRESYLRRFLHYANNYVIKIKTSKKNIFKMASVKLKIITNHI